MQSSAKLPNPLPLSDLEKAILRTVTKERYVASNIWLDTPNSGAIFADFFKLLWGLKDKGLVKEWATDYSALGSIPHGQREFFLSQAGLRLKERLMKEEKHGVPA